MVTAREPRSCGADGQGKEITLLRFHTEHAFRRYLAVLFPLLIVVAATETALTILSEDIHIGTGPPLLDKIRETNSTTTGGYFYAISDRAYSSTRNARDLRV